MADLLSSILGSMEKPPTLGDAERKKAREHKKRIEKLQEEEKEKLHKFRSQIQEKVNKFVKDIKQEHIQFATMNKVFRTIIHEVSDVAGLTSFSFGEEEVDRYVMLWKKEFAPTDEELSAYRKGDAWDPVKAKEFVKQQKIAAICERRPPSPTVVVVPNTNYRDKYEHLIGKVAAKEAAVVTTANASYGFVPSENKRDHRTIEEVMAESRAKKMRSAAESSSESRTEPEKT